MNPIAYIKDLSEVAEVLLNDFRGLRVRKIFMKLLVFSYAPLFLARKMLLYFEMVVLHYRLLSNID